MAMTMMRKSSWNKFQFPSNGKVFPNSGGSYDTTTEVLVSIPFKREGVSELNKCRGDISSRYLMVSIPFKREGVSEQMNYEEIFRRNLFQFPSNGKVFPNASVIIRHQKTPTPSFNSLQTGRCFRTLMPQSNRYMMELCFNSLQTGRCFRTEDMSSLPRKATRSFNSLQTGRCFRTQADDATEEEAKLFQFPSNGKVFPNE